MFPGRSSGKGFPPGSACVSRWTRSKTISPFAQMAEAGRAFEFLKDEPDLYSEADIKQQNV
jgi:hypothetical protein